VQGLGVRSVVVRSHVKGKRNRVQNEATRAKLARTRGHVVGDCQSTDSTRLSYKQTQNMSFNASVFGMHTKRR
jgi:hypothetical protein